MEDRRTARLTGISLVGIYLGCMLLAALNM